MKNEKKCDMFPEEKKDVVGQLVVIDVNKQWLSLMSIDVMGVFGEVSKVVPLWNISKHGPHRKTL
jgi:hypothetical protein